MNKKIRLMVTTGPDRGQTETFSLTSIRIGRDHTNDFCLSDGFVSNFHGRIIWENNTYRYEDLESRHGSLLTAPKSESSRTSTNNICNGATLYIGCTEILITVLENMGVAEPTEANFSLRKQHHTMIVPSDFKFPDLDTDGELEDFESGAGGLFLTSSYERRTSVARRIGNSDSVLDLFFDLSGKLNAATSLDEVLDHVVEATFDTLPSANYFSITMMDDQGSLEKEPYIARLRGKPTKGCTVDEELITSRSIMLRALQKREGILLTNEDLKNHEHSQSIKLAQISASMCVPLIGQHSILGVLQVETRGQSAIFSEHELDIITLLGSSVAFAIERAKLTGNLEQILEKFVDASVTAIEARDPTTAGHSHRVANYTLELAKEVNLIKTGPWGETLLSHEELRELRYAALLHDFGKICVHENVLQKASRLPEGGIEHVKLRFDLITSLYESESLRALIADTPSRSSLETPEELLYEHNIRVTSFKNSLDRDYRFLLYLNTAPFLKDDDINRMKRIASRTFRTLSGEPRTYLTSDEVENLSIRRGTLNQREWLEMRSHAQRSEEYLRQIPWTQNLRQIPCLAGAHHEKLDGSGYPRGLLAKDIPVQVRMMTIADIFDALTASDRPYRKAAPKEGALQVLHAEADDGKLDRDLVLIFEAKVVPGLKL